MYFKIATLSKFLQITYIRFFAPHFKKDVQQRAMEMATGLEYVTDEDRLKELKLFNLAKRR